MPFLLPDEARERRSGAQSPGTARGQITREESEAYVKMIPAPQGAHASKRRTPRCMPRRSLKIRQDTRQAISATDQSRPH